MGGVRGIGEGLGMGVVVVRFGGSSRVVALRVRGSCTCRGFHCSSFGGAN